MNRLNPVSITRVARSLFRLGQTFAAFTLVLAGLLASGNEAFASKRVALVIGNSAYVNAGVLANPSNDATDIAVALNELGFTVVVGNDLDNRGMREKIREFASALRGADTAMFFYAGHAVQVNGRNYLAPVDTKLEFESDVDFETIPIEFIQRQMERETDTILLFLDACRDNPISRSMTTASRSSGSGKGLAEEKLSAAGTFIAFSTDPGNVALDGKGRNSPFAKALIDNIKRPGVEISTMMTDVRVQVRKETNDQQTPWANSSLLGHFFFNPVDEVAGEADKLALLSSAPAASSSTAINPSSGKVDDAKIAGLAWESVKDSESIETLEYFLASYGNTFYAGLAKLRIEKLKAGNTTAAASTETKPAETANSDDAAKPADAAAQEPAAETKLASLDSAEATRAVEPLYDERETALGIQKELVRLGCGLSKADGLWGDRSERALETFRKIAKVKLASTSPDPQLLNQLRSHKGASCFVQKKVAPKAKTKVAKVEPAPEPRQKTKRKKQRVQPQEEVVVQRRQQRVIVDEGPVFIEEPQPRRRVVIDDGGGGGGGLSIGGAIGGGIVCIVGGC